MYAYAPRRVGVFFKFVADVRGMYGSDAKALKVAGAELVGLRAYAECHLAGLHVPLMTLVDYRGYRLIASCQLPLSKDTLVYGSADGTALASLVYPLSARSCCVITKIMTAAGKTVHADDATLNAAMQQAATQLNLKPHRCGQAEVLLAAPCDIEGHRGTDGRYAAAPQQ